MRFSITHSTRYQYRRPVVQSHHQVHLRPRELPHQKVLTHRLDVEPAPAHQTALTDYFGNASVLLRIDQEHSEFTISAHSTVEITPSNTPDLERSQPWDAPVGAGGASAPAIIEFTCPSRHCGVSRPVADFARASFPAQRPVLAGAMDLTQRIFREFKFDPAATDVSTPIERVLTLQRGVCQDFAHLAIAALRSLGIPARYVSGYLLTRPPPGHAKLAGSDASHAWLSVWAPEIGWVDFDPTNGLIPAGEHITVAYGRDYDDISPISGVLLGGGDQTMSVAVDVVPTQV